MLNQQTQNKSLNCFVAYIIYDTIRWLVSMLKKDVKSNKRCQKSYAPNFVKKKSA